MISKIKQGLEGMVNFVKDNSKKAIVTAGIVAMATAPVRASTIDIYNHSQDTNYSSMTLSTQNGADETLDLIDTERISSPWLNGLEIYSDVEGVELRKDARPLNTPGIDAYLNVKGTLQGTTRNSIAFQVLDNEGLDHREVIAYDINTPNEIHEVPKNGDLLMVPLPNLVNQSAGEYATWRIETPPIVPGDCASDQGSGILDGKVDIYDIQELASSWLNHTVDGENFDNADVNYDGNVNLQDFAIMAKNYTPSE